MGNISQKYLAEISRYTTLLSIQDYIIYMQFLLLIIYILLHFYNLL